MALAIHIAAFPVLIYLSPIQIFAQMLAPTLLKVWLQIVGSQWRGFSWFIERQGTWIRIQIVPWLFSCWKALLQEALQPIWTCLFETYLKICSLGHKYFILTTASNKQLTEGTGLQATLSRIPPAWALLLDIHKPLPSNYFLTHVLCICI